jgi:hypothetical protein
MTKRARVPGLYLEVLLRVLLSRKTSLHLGAPAVNDSDLLQKDLSALEKWEEEWQMSFHPQKCTVIRIATNQRHVIPTQYTLQKEQGFQDCTLRYS